MAAKIDIASFSVGANSEINPRTTVYNTAKFHAFMCTIVSHIRLTKSSCKVIIITRTIFIVLSS